MSRSAARVLLLAGGSGSIGLAIAHAAAAEGWAVALHGRTQASAAVAAQGVGHAAQSAANIKPFSADFTDGGAIERLVAEAGAWRERIDAVIDCTSMGPMRRLTGAFSDTEPDGFADFLDLSVVNCQRLAHAALPWLQRSGGTFIAFASDAGRFAAPRQSVVGTARAAIIGFVRNLATEVARNGVRVHCISPSFVDGTNSTKRLAADNAERMARLRKIAGLGLPTPQDIAPLALFLCGDGARKMTGQVISINGGANA